MMSDYDDYENNLAFEPVGDWSDKGEVPTTDRTQSSLELVDKIEELTKWLDLKSEYIVKLEDENTKLKELLEDCREVIEWYKADCGYKDAPTDNVLTKIDEVLK